MQMESIQVTAVWLSVVLIGLSTSVVTLRFSSRRLQGQGFGVDDYITLPAFVRPPLNDIVYTSQI